MKKKMNYSSWKIRVKKFFLRRFPICSWISIYTKEDAFCDLIAGITIALTMIPQSIAYAALAGLDPQYGLNSAFMGCLIYVFFGAIKEVVIGPSSLMALMVYQYTQNLNVDFVILLTFLSGIVELIMGCLHLGFLVSYISAPVVSAFTSATSVIVIVAQLKGLFGLHFSSSGFFDNMRQLFNNLVQIKLGDSILGISCIILLLTLRYLKELKISKDNPKRKLLKKIFWFLATARNALIVILASSISIAYANRGLSPPFVTSKHIDSGLPEFKFPPLSTQIGNQTYNFMEMVSELGGGYIMIPIVSIAANIAIGKAFVKGSVDATQEMLALALCNIFGSCFQSIATTGAFTRSAVISASGVRTPLACLYSAGITLLALAFLGPYFRYIPRATLAAVLIAAVVFLIDVNIIRPLYKTNKFDFITLLITFVTCLGISFEIGMLIGVIISLLPLIYKWSKPGVTVETREDSNGAYAILIPQNDLYFPSADYITSIVIKNSSNKDGTQLPVYIDCSKITTSDYSTAKNITIISKTLEKRGQPFFLTNVSKNLMKTWKSAGCDENQFCDSITVDNSLFELHSKHHKLIDFRNKPIDIHFEEEIQELANNERTQ